MHPGLERGRSAGPARGKVTVWFNGEEPLEELVYLRVHRRGGSSHRA